MSYTQVKHEQFGDPLEVLKAVKVDGIPTAVKPTDVVVHITASPIHPGLLKMITGIFGGTPGVPGIEAAGVISSIGAGVTKFKVGQRVVLGLVVPLALFVRLLTYKQSVTGTWTEYIVQSEDQLFPHEVPADISDAEISQWKTNTFTAYGLLVLESKFEKGDWALVTAAGSALGKVIIQLAKILIVRREEQIAELKQEPGIEHVLQYSGDASSFLAQVKKITNGRGIKSAFDPVAGETAEAVYQALAEDGQLLACGTLSGPPLLGPSLGFYSVFDTFARPDASQIAEKVWKWVVEKKITFTVAKVYAFEDFAEAIKHSNQTGARGKVLLGAKAVTGKEAKA